MQRSHSQPSPSFSRASVGMQVVHAVPHRVSVQQPVGVACFATLHLLGQAVQGWSFLPSYKSGSSGAHGDSGFARVQEGTPIDSFSLLQQHQPIGLVLGERSSTRSSREVLTMDLLNFFAVDF